MHAWAGPPFAKMIVTKLVLKWLCTCITVTLALYVNSAGAGAEVSGEIEGSA